MVDLKEIFKSLNNSNYNNRNRGTLFQDSQDSSNYILNGIKLKKTTINLNGISLELFIRPQNDFYSRSDEKCVDLEAINLQDYLSKGILFQSTVSFLEPFKKIKFVSFDVISSQTDLTKKSCNQAILKYYEEKSGILSSQLKHYGTLSLDDNDHYRVETSYQVPLTFLFKYYENYTGIQFEVDYIDS